MADERVKRRVCVWGGETAKSWRRRMGPWLVRSVWWEVIVKWITVVRQSALCELKDARWLCCAGLRHVQRNQDHVSHI
eukprot:3841179-Rhodomonas_salina.2